MGLLGWIASRQIKARVTRLAPIVAEQCREAVWCHVLSRAGTLRSDAEARGYVRARAGRIVQRKIQLVTLQSPLPAAVERLLWETSVELVVGQLTPHLVVREHASTTLRKAA